MNQSQDSRKSRAVAKGNVACAERQVNVTTPPINPALPRPMRSLAPNTDS